MNVWCFEKKIWISLASSYPSMLKEQYLISIWEYFLPSFDKQPTRALFGACVGEGQAVFLVLRLLDVKNDLEMMLN